MGRWAVDTTPYTTNYTLHHNGIFHLKCQFGKQGTENNVILLLSSWLGSAQLKAIPASKINIIQTAQLTPYCFLYLVLVHKYISSCCPSLLGWFLLLQRWPTFTITTHDICRRGHFSTFAPFCQCHRGNWSQSGGKCICWISLNCMTVIHISDESKGGNRGIFLRWCGLMLTNLYTHSRE